ncbi:tRNA lysidine(34) synthetase TilS [Paenibacillus lentus]|uniref:tRNA(Ile)-lysidine synthase n=1 Tax=Paenibacillus lentus TaxID=1338368 RepID=A0A3Q8S3W2_9BACL|nr:tRNA lysidine(34) synthetase TilS [Paenibacillus lentus]AZK45525.1 tRNA lysidine(34) synthetase TilS [Paenibacillus lentus]
MNDYSMYPLVERVRRIGEEERLWSPGDRIVVAVSGGPDSVALLYIMHAIAKRMNQGFSLICAHINHGFRPEESLKEAEFVRGLAKQLDLPFELGNLDIPSYIEQSGKSPQLAAREKRYEFLHEIARKYGAAAIALAHHADDQAETVMMRILRGSGSSGLAGMRMKRCERNVNLIRPLLRIYKAEILQACRESGIPYCIDSTNLQNKYVRNAIRLDVLPFLGQYNGQLAESLNRIAETVGEDDDYMQQVTNQVYQELVTSNGGDLAFEIGRFTSLHAALQRRLIKLILNYLPCGMEEIDFVKIERVRQGAMQSTPTTWSLDLGGGLQCVREYDTIRFIPNAAGVNDSLRYTYRVDRVPAEVAIQGLGTNLLFTQTAAGQDAVSAMAHGNDRAVFDADELVYPLTVRSRQPGDTMKVLGLNGTKKVKDIFIDEKIPPSLRSRIPIVTDGLGQILWIPGIRRSSIAPVRQHTSSVVLMTIDRNGE